MCVDKTLLQRSNDQCELCKNADDLVEFVVLPKDDKIVVCGVCNTQLQGELDSQHWHCLNDSMWSEIDAIKVVVFRVLTKLNNQDLLDMLYLEDDLLSWAKEGLPDEDEELRKDSNGNTLVAGDTITLIKDLDVKGAKFTAKRGTVVKNIRIGNVSNHIEGKINGTTIYLKCDFIKK
jgi:protein PhnA